MVNRSLIRSLENDPDIQAMFESAIADFHEDDGLNPAHHGADFDVNKIVEGRILRVADGMVMIDIGFKSEGSIPLEEWDEGEEPPQVGQLVRVLIEDLEDEQAQIDESGMVRISKRKAKKQDDWEKMMKEVKEGQNGQGPRHPQDQGRFARRYRRERLLASQPSRHPSSERHRRLHRSRRSSAKFSRSTKLAATSSSAVVR